MAVTKQHYLVCYDIRDEKRWRKCYKLLKEYGERVQYSVFHCYLTDLKMAKLRWNLEKVLSSDDSLLIAPVKTPDNNKFVVMNSNEKLWDFNPERFETF